MQDNEDEKNKLLEEAFSSFMNRLSQIKESFLSGISSIRKINDEETLSNLRKKFSQTLEKND